MALLNFKKENKTDEGSLPRENIPAQKERIIKSDESFTDQVDKQQLEYLQRLEQQKPADKEIAAATKNKLNDYLASSGTASSKGIVIDEQILSDVEDILEEDLEELYLKLSPNKQREFKKTGEEVTSKIAQMVQLAHIRVKEILALIRRWLNIIPGVNKFFLEQEAKIKVDKILELSQKKTK